MNQQHTTFEDPTDELQLLREGVDVERAASSGWLPELAAKTAAVAHNSNGASTYANGNPAQAAASKASSSKGKGPLVPSPGDKENAPSAAPLPNLALPADSEARARKELRLTKEQVRRIWESLLFRQKAMQSEPGIGRLKTLIGQRLACNKENTKMAEGKRVVNGEGEGFVMMRFPADLAAKLPKSTEPEGHDGSTGAAAKDSDIAEMIDARIQDLEASLG
ncbi:hypothetical protein WJX84_006874 [Apatococcus fuscideae]|uniref:Uncharacterized protein n=1 Tax=Apatococcus fuscideae TaxID=2026836 RepID=A0AAW1SRY4_9CHLO